MPLIGVVNGRARARRAKRRVGPTTPWLPHLSEVFAEIKEEVKKRVRPKSAPGFRMAEMLYNDVHEGHVTGWHVLQPARVHPGLPADLERPKTSGVRMIVDGTARPRSTAEKEEAMAIDSTSAIAETLGIERQELAVLQKVFESLDADRNRRASVVEFLMHLDVERSPLTLKIFSIFDSDGDGSVDFREFVVSLFQFCSLSPLGLLDLCFKLYAKRYGDNIYLLKRDDIASLLDAMYGTDQHKRARQRRERTRDHLLSLCVCGELHLDGWSAWVQRNPNAARPLITVQQQMRDTCGGHKFWSKIADRRKEDFGDATWVDIEDIVRERHNFGRLPPALPPKDQSKKQGPSKKKPPPLRLSPEAESRKRHRTALAELRAKTGTPTKPKRTPPGTPTGPNAAPADRLIHLAVETLLEKNSRALEDRRASVVATG